MSSDFLGIHAADAAHSIKGQDADRTGKPTGSNADERPDPASLGPLSDNVFRSSNSTGIIRERKPERERGQAFRFHMLTAAEQARRDGFDRNAAEEERRNAPDQPDDRSALPPRKDPRRQP